MEFFPGFLNFETHPYERFMISLDFLETVQRVHLHVIQSLTQRELMTSQSSYCYYCSWCKKTKTRRYTFIFQVGCAGTIIYILYSIWLIYIYTYIYMINIYICIQSALQCLQDQNTSSPEGPYLLLSSRLSVERRPASGKLGMESVLWSACVAMIGWGCSDYGRSWCSLWLSFCWLRMVILQWFKSFPWVSRRQLSLKICKLASE